MNLEHLSTWLRLQQLPKMGLRTLAKIAWAFDSPNDFLQASSEQLQNAGFQSDWVDRRKPLPTIDISTIEHWLAENSNHFIITISDPEFPPLLKQIPDPPPILYGIGDPNVLNSRQLAIVGTRKPSPAGVQHAKHFATTLAQIGFTITSGLATGIDGSAHLGALSGNGKTIAVAGTGLDRVYPAHHRQLAHDIAQQGALISEFALGTRVHGSHFPQRNRIIAGLSLGVLVVEAAQKSGSLITARFASEHGREVFAIPGSINNERVKGCHYLIKQGATLVENIDDILSQLGCLAMAQAELTNQTSTSILEPAEATVLELIDYSPTEMDQLVLRSQKSVADLSSILLTLELKGCVAQSSGGYQRLK